MTDMNPSPTTSSKGNKTGGHGGHGWMMVACCIPMLIIAGVLVVTDVVSVAFLIYAVACLAMMGVMMWMMDRGRMKM